MKVDFTTQLQERILYVTNSEQCFKTTTDGVREIVSLRNTQEEADTRIFHAEYISTQYTEPSHVVIHTPDTDVVLLVLAFDKDINSPLFKKTGNKDKARIINIDELIKNVQTRMKEETSSDNIGEAILGLHAFTGCNTVSAFAWKGKVKALNVMLKSEIYITTFISLGTSWQLSEFLMKQLERCNCDLYHTEEEDVTIRYDMYCSKRGKVQTQMLPPCRSALIQHCKLANYQCRV